MSVRLDRCRCFSPCSAELHQLHQQLIQHRPGCSSCGHDQLPLRRQFTASAAQIGHRLTERSRQSWVSGAGSTAGWGRCHRQRAVTSNESISGLATPRYRAGLRCGMQRPGEVATWAPNSLRDLIAAVDLLAIRLSRCATAGQGRVIHLGRTDVDNEVTATRFERTG